MRYQINMKLLQYFTSIPISTCCAAQGSLHINYGSYSHSTSKKEVPEKQALKKIKIKEHSPKVAISKILEIAPKTRNTFIKAITTRTKIAFDTGSITFVLRENIQKHLFVLAAGIPAAETLDTKIQLDQLAVIFLKRHHYNH